MANPEHVRIVHAGREAILEWRDDFPQDQLDLSGADLQRFDLTGANLKWADLSHAKMKKCRLSGANLTQAVLSQAELRSANCRGAIFRGSILREADLSSADFTKADLNRANLTGAKIRRAKFFGASLRHADLSLVDATRANLSSANLYSAKLQRAILRDAILLGTELDGAQLHHADLRRASFQRCSLNEASFQHAICGGTIWAELDLSVALHLETMKHLEPSIIDVMAAALASSTLPPEFLRGCGFGPLKAARLQALAEGLVAESHAFLCCDESDQAVVEQVANELAAIDVICWVDAWDQSGTVKSHRWAEGGLLPHEQILICASDGLFKNPAVGSMIECALQAEAKAKDSSGRSVVSLIDLDGALQEGAVNSVVPGEWLEHQVADFSRCIREPKQFDKELANIKAALQASLAKHATRSSQNIDPVDELRSLIGSSSRLHQGFDKLVVNDGGNSIWYNFRGQKAPSHHLRQTEYGRRIEWESTIVEEIEDRYVYFVFAGCFGNRTAPKSGGFELRVNGFGPVEFDVVRDARCWQCEKKEVTLFYAPQWQSKDDSAGFFYVALAHSCLKAGETCRFMVRSKGSDSKRWFGIQPTTSTVELQRDSVILSSYG